MAAPQQLMAAFLSAVARGTDEAALQALQKCERDPSFGTACAAGALDASQLQGPDGRAHTPLFIAASRGLERSVARLLELGASGGVVQVRTSCAERPRRAARAMRAVCTACWDVKTAPASRSMCSRNAPDSPARAPYARFKR